MMKRGWMMLGATVLITGCAMAPAPPHDMTLDQLLGNQNKAEQRKMLLDLCLAEVAKRPYDLITHRFYSNKPEIPLLEQICKKMAAEMAPCDVVVKDPRN